MRLYENVCILQGDSEDMSRPNPLLGRSAARGKLVRENLRCARSKWGAHANSHALLVLKRFTSEFEFSVTNGDLLLLDRGWYVTHAGLIRLAQRKRCYGIHVSPSLQFSDPSSSRWAFQAIVYKTARCKGFTGFGDADPSNVSSLVHGAEMRVAETRAVNRALRKAYGIGICSIEELGTQSGLPGDARESAKIVPTKVNNGSWVSGPTVRDRLCQIIRQHQLDPKLVKAYAIDFCGTETLKEATREQIEEFVRNLSDWAQKDRNALLCQLNSYSSKSEGAA